MPPAVAEKFPRYESTDGEVTLADALATVFTCSGVADSFILAARTNGALVQITDRLGRESDEITILPGESVPVDIPGSVVRARNLVAAANAALSVTALYASPAGNIEA